MSESTTTAAAPAAAEPRHGLRILLIWLPLAIIADVLIWTVWYPHMPPGRMSDQAKGQQFDIAVMAMLCAPVLLFVWTYFAYALITWRRREGDDEDGPPIHGNTKIQATWITATAVIVLGLFVFGTVELIAPAGAGGGEGPSPIWNPSGITAAEAASVSPAAWTPGGSTPLVVQAIGQQWTWSYRFPQFGGMETTQLLLPVNTQVVIHVTSLDVIHSFWSYELGVKADANPGVDNVAFFKPLHLGSFDVRCNELCGIWHGAMFNYGRVVTPSAFQTWAAAFQAKEQANGTLAALPPYANTYDPTVIPQLGKGLVKIVGITGAPGYYYSPANPVQP
jgi:cytochrome c oxidase subunit II